MNRYSATFLLMSTLVLVSCSHPGNLNEKRKIASDSNSCGTEGKVDDRILHCQTKKIAKVPKLVPYKKGTKTIYTKFNWTLVTRTEEGNEVWMDDLTKLVWSSRLKEEKNFEQAKTACVSTLDELGGDLTDVTWRLPSADILKPEDDYLQANQHGIRDVFSYQDMYKYIYWSSSISSTFDAHIFWAMYGVGIFEVKLFEDLASVRCVGSQNISQ